MKIIIRPRAAGKTTELLRHANNYNGYLVVIDLKEVYRVSEVAKALGLRINMPITFDEFLRGEYHGRGCRVLWIDNADLLIERISAARVGAISLSEPQPEFVSAPIYEKVTPVKRTPKRKKKPL